jgi:hypothetical protein
MPCGGWSCWSPISGRVAQALTQRSDGHHLVLQVIDDYIRDVIHAFNVRRFDALDSEGAGDDRGRSVI